MVPLIFGNPQVALGLFREMRSFKPSIVAANAVISAFGMASEWQRALTQFRSSSYTLKPDVVTYAAVMTALEKASQWQRTGLLLRS